MVGDIKMKGKGWYSVGNESALKPEGAFTGPVIIDRKDGDSISRYEVPFKVYRDLISKAGTSTEKQRELLAETLESLTPRVIPYEPTKDRAQVSASEHAAILNYVATVTDWLYQRRFRNDAYTIRKSGKFDHREIIETNVEASRIAQVGSNNGSFQKFRETGELVLEELASTPQ